METKTTTAKRWRISSDDLQFQRQQHCLHQLLPAELGMGRSAIFQLDQDLSYIETCYAPSRDLAVLSRLDCLEPRLIVTLGLQGQSRFTNERGNELIFNEGYTSITPLHGPSSGERQYQAHKATLQLRFALNRSWLDNYFGEADTARLFDKNRTQLLPTSIQAAHAAQKLLNRNVPRETSRLFMHGQALSLLASELGRLFKETSRHSTAYRQKEADIAKSARDILFHEFNDPPSITELSKRVGTNPCKLKKLFHHYFNNTPYGLLLEIRMNNAYHLLESKQCPVSVAAYKVGYSHASNFSTAFIKYFGVSPKAIAKTTLTNP